jgi:hypothetical protein
MGVILISYIGGEGGGEGGEGGGGGGGGGEGGENDIYQEVEVGDNKDR